MSADNWCDECGWCDTCMQEAQLKDFALKRSLRPTAVVKATEFKMNTVTVEPGNGSSKESVKLLYTFTATEDGSKHEECKNCDDEKAAVKIPATGTSTGPTTPEDPEDPKTPGDAETPENSGAPATPKSAPSPKTGDSNKMGLWLALLFVSGGALTATTLCSRKKKDAK